MKYLKTSKLFAFSAAVLWIGLSYMPCFQANAAISTAGIKGVNNAHIWWDSQSYTALDAIKNNGFNTVRVIWQTKGNVTRLKEIIDRCHTLGLKPILELHDVTGSTSNADLERMVNYWIANKSVISTNLWLNIANEWGSENGTAWRDAYKSAITKLRNAGFANTLVIDAPGWGQDANCIKTYGKELLTHDPQHNLVFSVHMYGLWNDTAKIRSELTTLKNLDLPVLVGEFGYNYNNGNNNLNCKVDAAALIATCKELGIGYVAWSWCGNDPKNAWLDLTDHWGKLTEWGNLVVKSQNSSTPTATSSTTTSTKLLLASFEQNIENWSGSGISGGPWVTTEWRCTGTYSLKADVALANQKQFSLYKTQTVDFSGKTQLKAVVRHAPWGTLGTGFKAKLYVKTNNGSVVYAGDPVTVNSNANGTVLTLNLTKVSSLNDISEYGVNFISGTNSAGLSAIYLDYVIVQ